MNTDFLSRSGCDQRCAQGLGQYRHNFNIPAALRYVLMGIRGSPIGDICDFMHFHRYGSTGWEDGKGKGCGYESHRCVGCRAFASAQADAAQQILDNPSLATEGWRVCENIPHVR